MSAYLAGKMAGREEAADEIEQMRTERDEALREVVLLRGRVAALSADLRTAEANATEVTACP